MPAAVFSHIEPFLVLFNTKWELGKIVIIDPVAAYTLFTGQPADMALNLVQPVTEHHRLIRRNHPAR